MLNNLIILEVDELLSKFVWSNTNFEDAEIILVGVPDESGSHAYRAGSSSGPDQIRKISNQRELFGPNRIAQSMTGEIISKVWDYGNITKKEVNHFINNILKKKKFPIAIGGDHSITAEILRGYPKNIEISLIYFDAHPDIIYSDRPYYGSVVADASKFVDLQKSVELGIREPELEEIRTLREKGILTLTPFDLMEIGIKEIFQIIKKRIGEYIYISVDMDCFDPAFAPGVSTPSPGGFSSTQVIYLLKKIARLGLVGFDIMETNPKFDINDMTSHLAARLIVETLTDLKVVHVY
ncbi:MAG: arginase family protein [Candidatus Lokiarchaeota archaeon]|nr:arginase family protein [Candidatus Lokiarchaeota archaeon]